MTTNINKKWLKILIKKLLLKNINEKIIKNIKKKNNFKT